MKKIWKVLAIAAAASLLPYKLTRDEDTGETRVDALLWQYTRRPRWDGEEHREITIFPDRLPHRIRAEEEIHFEDCGILTDGPGDPHVVVEYPTEPEAAAADEPLLY